MRDYILVTFQPTASKETIDALVKQIPFEKDSILPDNPNDVRRMYVFYAEEGKKNDILENIRNAIPELNVRYEEIVKSTYTANTRFPFTCP